jgi:hypothetical protein
MLSKGHITLLFNFLYERTSYKKLRTHSIGIPLAIYCHLFVSYKYEDSYNATCVSLVTVDKIGDMIILI